MYSFSLKDFSSLLFVLFFMSACSVKELSLKESNQKIRDLELSLINLSPRVDRDEAYSLARSSILYSQELAQKYQAISFPWIQNTLVNVGMKKRGLCYEWSEDLLLYLLQKRYKTLVFYNIGANIGYLNEHNALSVSAKGEGINNSIVLDAWRGSGDLYFNEIDKDIKYEWKERIGLYKNLPQ